MSDEIKVIGLEIKVDGKKLTLSIEKAWELKRELDKLLRVEPFPFLPYVPLVPYTEPYPTPSHIRHGAIALVNFILTPR